MHWSITILSCWYPSKLPFQQHQNTGIFYRFMRLFWCLSRQLVVSQTTTMLCVTNCYAVCDLGISFTVIIPSPWATVLSVSFVSPSSGHLKGLSLPTLALFFHEDWSWTTRLSLLTLIFTNHWLHDIVFCVHNFSPSPIPTSSSRLAYLHWNINSELYSMLSTCLSVSPISIPPVLSTFASLPLFTAERTTVRLRGGGGTRWLPT